MKTSSRSQQGVFLLEALIGILVFSLGVLAMVALGTAAVSAQSDAQYRTQAANLANEIASLIALKVNRIEVPGSDSLETAQLTRTAVNDSLLPFRYHPVTAATCNFTGYEPPNTPETAFVAAWVNRATTDAETRLPGALSSGLQIDTTTLKDAGLSGVRVTVCWQGPTDKSVRSHTLVTYIN
ncbi:type IV pilus modification PilV family protein [Candidatus Accumulibacter aalborgensis]|nr:hypothetical protein [Candidatus Accumulibacter aalborgensis]